MAQPEYRRILHDLRAHIMRGVWRVGEQIPTDEELTQRYGVSRFTVRAAVDVLVADGLVQRFRGRGSFVAARSGETDTWMLTSLGDLVQGSFPTPPIIIDSKRVRCPTVVSAALGLGPTAMALCIRVVRRRGKEPYACSVIHVPAALLKRLPRDWPMRLESEAFVNGVAAANGLVVHRAIQIAQALGAPRDIAPLLDVEEGAPLLLLERTFLDREGTALEHACVYCRPERYRQVIEFRAESRRKLEETELQPDLIREDVQ